MNDIDEFLLVTLGLFFGITVLMLVLTYLERTLSDPARAPKRSVSVGRERKIPFTSRSCVGAGR